MLTMMGSTIALLALAFPALAEEVKGKVKSVDAEKNTITVTVGEQERTLDVSKDVKVTHRVGKSEKKAKSEDLPGGLSGVKAGIDVVLSTETKDDKVAVTQIKVEGLTPKKK